MGPSVLIPGFITPVLCLTNRNRQFPFLYNTVSHRPGPDTAPRCSRSDTAHRAAGTLVSIGVLAFHVPGGHPVNPVARGVNVVDKTHAGQQHRPAAWGGPSPEAHGRRGWC